MTEARKAVAVLAADVPVRTRPSNDPEPFASRMAGRSKQALGEVFGLQNFGVNRVDDDLRAEFREGRWVFSHKDGTPYE